VTSRRGEWRLQPTPALISGSTAGKRESDERSGGEEQAKRWLQCRRNRRSFLRGGGSAAMRESETAHHAATVLCPRVLLCCSSAGRGATFALVEQKCATLVVGSCGPFVSSINHLHQHHLPPTVTPSLQRDWSPPAGEPPSTQMVAFTALAGSSPTRGCSSESAKERRWHSGKRERRAAAAPSDPTSSRLA
jgi:hypothetical protein